MKANSLEELVTNSNIAGELRNYTDWHTRLVKFAQLVADWQKDALLEWARKLNETYHKEYELSRYTCGEHWGQMVAFQKVIDKLNSM